MNLRHYRPEFVKTYATEANAIKAAEKKFGNTNLRFMVLKTEDNRYGVMFIGEPALQHGVHFHFNVVG